MRRKSRSKRPTRPVDLHREWLELVDTDGPFLAAPALVDTWAQGMPPLNAQKRDSLRDARADFEKSWDKWRAEYRPEDAHGLDEYLPARDKWVRFVLSDAAGWGEGYGVFDESDHLRNVLATSSPGGLAKTSPTGILKRNDKVGALVLVVDPMLDKSLSSARGDRWSASALDRMQIMLRLQQSPCEIGIVTDGRWWAIVSAPQGRSAAWGQFDSQTWGDEPRTRDAFFELISPRRLVTAKEENRLPFLFAESVTASEEVTDALGKQVRRAVELIVSALSEAAADVRASGEEDPLPDEGSEVYEAAVIVMMRVVFLLFAQERGLLPDTRLFEASYGLVGVLEDLQIRLADEGAESLDGTYLTWHRLLATSNAIFEGVSFEDMRMPAYGGSVFDPDRHEFLLRTKADGELALTVSDRVMLEVLRSVQYAQVSGDARRVSFRELDVEQIGYIYEGLLGYSCSTAKEVVLGLVGKEGQEPEVPLSVLEDLRRKHQSDSDLAGAIIRWVKDNRPASATPTKARMAKLLASQPAIDSDRVLRSVTRDEGMRARLLPWMGVIRRDLRDKPTVFLEGSRFVTETSSRKNAGAHYTPRSLAEEVVKYALEPLLYEPGPHQTSDQEMWVRKSSDDILDLRVADIACGSGAFLVAAARFLSSELVEAWHEEGRIRSVTDEQRLHAMREVVARCLYGVDINEMAVEMCKLSLWLVSLDRDRPFSFVDNKVFVGNSLLGLTSMEQLSARRVDGKLGQTSMLFAGEGASRLAVASLKMDEAVAEAVTLRRRLAEPIDERDPVRSASAKTVQMRRLREKLSSIRMVADAVVASALLEGAKPGRKLEDRYSRLEEAIVKAFQRGDSDTSDLEAIIDAGLTPTVETDYERWRCLHWPLDMPEVIVEHGGFDAIIGNPPFLGGQKLKSAMGTNVRDWYVNAIACGVSGSADLCAYFFLRAFSLLNEHGSLGLLATNTIAQGTTREVGLDRMLENGFTITRSIRSRPWPVKTANLEYAAVWGTNDKVSPDVKRICDDVPVSIISGLLEPRGRVSGNPVSLSENLGIAFQGCIVLGNGFVIDEETAEKWISVDSRNAEVLFPFINGRDLNSRADCSGSRWIIDFNNRTEDEASSFELPFMHVEEHVKPERLAKEDPAVRNAPWWLYLRARGEMREAVSGLDEVLALTLVSKTVMPLRVPKKQVFSHAVGVFAMDSYAFQATISSSIHQLWAIKQGSGMRGDPRYTPTDVFETFPRPPETDGLRCLGKELDEFRRKVMLRRELGLTDLYNLINNPDYSIGFDTDVDRIRDIHRQIDEAVMVAYGWDDIELNHGFYTYRSMTRWSVCDEAREEILDRLLEENHRRAGVQS